MQTNAVPITTEEMAEGRLPKTSWIRCDKVFTLSANAIAKHYGRLNKVACRAAHSGFCKYMGCQPA